jgi:hypothetical protein
MIARCVIGDNQPGMQGGTVVRLPPGDDFSRVAQSWRRVQERRVETAGREIRISSL